MSEDKLEKELGGFKNIWEKGYFEGDCLDPYGNSGYVTQRLGYMSILYVTYLKCIKPYINDRTVALEIGPGRGSFTKAMLHAEEVQVLDAKSEEQNGFYAYLNHPENVMYHHVEDFSCSMLKENYFNYMFSFGCLCHVSFEGITQYATNIYSKLKPGSDCFWMIADYDKYNQALENRLDVSDVVPHRVLFSPLKYVMKAYLILNKNKEEAKPFKSKDEDNEPRPGRWYHAGLDRTCAMLEKVGYVIVEKDVETSSSGPNYPFSKRVIGISSLITD